MKKDNIRYTDGTKTYTIYFYYDKELNIEDWYATVGDKDKPVTITDDLIVSEILDQITVYLEEMDNAKYKYSERETDLVDLVSKHFRGN